MWSAAILSCLALTQKVGEMTPGEQLSPSTKPVLAVVGLHQTDVFSVSRYRTKEHPDPTTVFRYVFRGEMKATLASFQSRLKSSEGWKLEWISPKEPLLSRALAHGPVANQGLLFHPTRLLPSPNGGHGAPWPDGKGWIWVSYNEQVRTKK